MEKTLATNNTNAQFDEKRWLERVRRTFRTELEESLGVSVSVFDVPKQLRELKPEAYSPQFFALGPYHQHRPELRDMERYKINAAKRAEKCFKEIQFDHLTELFVKLESMIRAPYHRFLNFNEQTLAWMMAIDACFLLEFLENYQNEEGTGIVPPPTNWIGGIVKDIVMLENQIPLFLVRKTLELKSSSLEVADNTLSSIFNKFLTDVSPLKVTINVSNLENYSHILELLYHNVIPKLEGQIEQTEISIGDEEEITPEELEDLDKVKEALEKVSKLNLGPIRFIKDNLISKPFDALTKLPETLMKKIPVFAIFTPFVEYFMSQSKLSNTQSSINGLSVNNIIKSPLLEEITIPSVSKLSKAGITFVPTEEGIDGICFDERTAILNLPIVTLDANTEVTIRNLIAYEASVVKGALVFARYIELMNGIIDTEHDVKILRRSGVILNRMKSDKEVADLWNGMSRATKITRVPKIDRTIEDVKIFSSRNCKNKVNKFMKKYVYGAWPILTLLATMILLLMTGLQTFCSVYTCSRWFVDITPGRSD
ncbi:hypothetical protein LUZ60_002989 [Juncus effusus]|nr:hypothetical protein LUZ60_002989 [Juncus effusus]